MSVGDTFGAPSALAHLDAFYKAMTGAGLRSKVALVGLSRGGLYAYNWAARNPEKVSVIYGDAPVCNFASWPYAHGAPAGAPEWKKLLAVYGFTTDAQALSCPTQPIKEMEPLAAAHIPLINVVGDADTTVPYAENTAIIEQEYKKLGGEITVLHKPGCNHHPHGLDDPTPVVNFIMQHDA
jgi:alpha-beta hydrolase superfamily lysophospholipase